MLKDRGIVNVQPVKVATNRLIELKSVEQKADFKILKIEINEQKSYNPLFHRYMPKDIQEKINPPPPPPPQPVPLFKDYNQLDQQQQPVKSEEIKKGPKRG
jgi:hypothetical protein